MKVTLRRDGGRYNPYAPPVEPEGRATVFGMSPTVALGMVVTLAGLAIIVGFNVRGHVSLPGIIIATHNLISFFR